MLLESADSQLLLVDFQTRLMPAIAEHELVIANALRLARLANLMQVPLWATEQVPANLGPTVSQLQGLNAKVIAKSQFSACVPELLEGLRPAQRTAAGNARSLPKHLQKPVTASAERSTVVIAGCEAHVCLLQTALELIEEEFDVWVVTDACGSRTERNRDAAFDRLAGNGAELVTTEMVAFEWLRDARHPAFKDVLSLIK